MFRFAKRFVLRLLEKRGYCISFGEPGTFAEIVAAFRPKDRPFFFVQIGAFDGRGSDPIHQRVQEERWEGILVEPQTSAFATLQCNYAGCPGLAFENVAISSAEGRMPLYSLKDEFTDLFAGDHRMLASFDPKHILKHLNRDEDSGKVLEVREIPCQTLAWLLDKHAVKAVDLLVIDAEGHDFEILKTVPFDRIKPSIIRFEHAHLSAAEKGECIEMLNALGYKVLAGGYDMTAFQSRWIFD